MTFDFDDIGGIALGVGVSQDIQFQGPTRLTNLDPWRDDLDA